MAKKKKLSVWIAREFTVVAEDYDQAILKVQQYLNLSGDEMRKFAIETAEIDMDKGEKLYDGVDFR